MWLLHDLLRVQDQLQRRNELPATFSVILIITKFVNNGLVSFRPAGRGTSCGTRRH